LAFQFFQEFTVARQLLSLLFDPPLLFCGNLITLLELITDQPTGGSTQCPTNCCTGSGVSDCRADNCPSRRANSPSG
jgi:hypothetical protein